MKRWQEVTGDPNSACVRQRRQAALAAARQKVGINDRIAYFCKLAKGKNVLDIGVVDHQLKDVTSRDWLHGRLCKVAARCHGVDVLIEEVAELQRRGFSVSCVNLVETALPQQFDVIICGDVLEHVDQPGPLFRHCRMMLADDGVFAVSVPNPWYLNVISKALFGRRGFQDNADHVAWYDPSTLFELGDRFGFELFRYSGIGVSRARSASARFLLSVRPLADLCMCPEAFAKTMIYEFRKKAD